MFEAVFSLHEDSRPEGRPSDITLKVNNTPLLMLRNYGQGYFIDRFFITDHWPQEIQDMFQLAVTQDRQVISTYEEGGR